MGFYDVFPESMLKRNVTQVVGQPGATVDANGNVMTQVQSPSLLDNRRRL
jgi:hypothetical protein